MHALVWCAPGFGGRGDGEQDDEQDIATVDLLCDEVANLKREGDGEKVPPYAILCFKHGARRATLDSPRRAFEPSCLFAQADGRTGADEFLERSGGYWTRCTRPWIARGGGKERVEAAEAELRPSPVPR